MIASEPRTRLSVATHRTRSSVFGALLCSLSVLVLAAPAVTSAASTWRPNSHIGPIVFNNPIPDDADVIDKKSDGSFAVRADGGAIVRGIVFADPNTGVDGARAVWTTSKLVSYRGVHVGVNWQTAKQALGKRFKVVRHSRCGWLNSSSLSNDRTGPVSTQVYFSRKTGKVFRIALNEITEIGCPR